MALLLQFTVSHFELIMCKYFGNFSPLNDIFQIKVGQYLMVMQYLEIIEMSEKWFSWKILSLDGALNKTKYIMPIEL